MPSYAIRYEPAARRQLGKLPRDIQTRIVVAIGRLEHAPRPVGSRPLVGRAGHWRIRVGDYRVIYAINDGQLVVVVVELGHRREIYR